MKLTLKNDTNNYIPFTSITLVCCIVYLEKYISANATVYMDSTTRGKYGNVFI